MGALGIAVRTGALWVLAGALGMHYLVATAIAVEVSLLHNFFWHQGWTWAPSRPGRRQGHVFFPCAAKFSRPVQAMAARLATM